jgi:asparagine synthase (glutamine-hydrolysing)
VSGFVGFWQRDGQPADPVLLAGLTEALAFRGPDGMATWCRGPVGLGHARCVARALRDAEPQPLGLDDRYWIAGDIRLDAREDLIAALPPFAPSSAERVSRGESDAALVLRAWRAWGEGCLARLHGDFSFAIWDRVAQRLFCARDPFGVRPFFYADLPGTFLFGNTLDCLRRHPDVGDALDEQALDDFLACGQPLDPAASAFHDLRRLPAGHWLEASGGKLRVQHYFALPQDPELRYADAAQYVEQFVDVLSRAVADRAGDDVTGLSLSGGLDSGTIAAIATGKLGRAAVKQARAFCSGWNTSFRDPEPSFAHLTADALGLPLEIVEAAGDEPLRLAAGGAGPEPQDDFFRSEFVAGLERMAAATRVNLDGQGGDEIFRGETLLDEARRAPWTQLARDAWRTWRQARRPPTGLRAWWRGARAPLPPRSVARARLAHRAWGPYLESFDAGVNGVAVQTCWPCLDHRVVRFALALPPLPWCVDKHLVRATLAPVLPQSITARPKAPLAGKPLEAFLSRHPEWPAQQAWIRGELGERLDWARWQAQWRKRRGGAWELARPVALAQWLRQDRLARAHRRLPRSPAAAVNSGGAGHLSARAVP